MANLAHRARQLLQKHFLIIHPTADGNTAPSLRFLLTALADVAFYAPPQSLPAEKVHFQHTAKFINHLISEKANYTLQVRRRRSQSRTRFGPRENLRWRLEIPTFSAEPAGSGGSSSPL